MKEYEQIRYLYEHENLSQRQIAQRLQLSRNTVKKYLKGEYVPWVRKEGTGKNCSKLTPEVKQFIENCLKEDEKNHIKKQTHTAKRIYDRLVSERSFTGGESTVRSYVAELKGKLPKEVFIKLDFAPAEAIQVDWGEATIFISGTKTKVNIWCMRECFSKKFFVKAFYCQNEESFLEGIQEGLEYFGGVPKKIIFDNARVAVKEGFGLHARATDKYNAMSIHYSFIPTFCNVASGNEKGLVEGLVKYIRKNALVPIPKVKDINELNEVLLKKCDAYDMHKLAGENHTVGENFCLTREHFSELPIYRYDTTRTKTTRANEYSLVSFDHNKYSIPVKYAHKDVTVKGWGNSISIMYGNQEIAHYTRDYGQSNKHYELEHLLPLLQIKKRSILNSEAVKKEIPHEFYRFLERLTGPEDVYKGLLLYIDYGNKLLSYLPYITSIEALQAKLIEVKTPTLGIYPNVKVHPHNLERYNSLIGGRNND